MSKNTSSDSFEELLNKSREKFMHAFKQGDNGGKNSNPLFSGRKLMLSLLSISGALWLSTGFYTLQPDEEGVVLRFGKYVRTGVSGLNYKIPSPIESVDKLSVTRVNREEIGFHFKGEGSEPSAASEVHMLTGDENIVNIDFDVQWRIKDARNFLFSVRELPGENTVHATAESVMRDVIANSQISDAIAGERSNIEHKARQMLQEALDSYQMGVEILRVQMLKVEPPLEVIDAYRDVQSAKADREKQINKAIAYGNDIIPRARGEAERIMQEAEGYKQQQIALANGKATRFASVYEEYSKAKKVTRTRIYYDSVTKALQDIPKVIVDHGTGLVPYLPISDLVRNKPAEQPSTISDKD